MKVITSNNNVSVAPLPAYNNDSTHEPPAPGRKTISELLRFHRLLALCSFTSKGRWRWAQGIRQIVLPETHVVVVSVKANLRCSDNNNNDTMIIS